MFFLSICCSLVIDVLLSRTSPPLKIICFTYSIFDNEMGFLSAQRCGMLWLCWAFVGASGPVMLTCEGRKERNENFLFY